MKIFAYGRTEKGGSHVENEDSILVNQERNLYAVADGVTLPYGGRRASNRATEYLKSLFDGDLKKTIQDLNEKLVQEKQRDASIGTTTLTAAHFREDELIVTHVGDSSAYMISGGKIRRITMPDTVPGTHMLIQVVGQIDLDLHFYREKLSRGDIIILATDGVTDAISDKELATIVQENKDLKDIVDEVFLRVDEKPRLYKDDKSMIVISV